MADALKIAIVGDFNFSFNSHHATNLAIDHSKLLLELDVNYYWIRISEASECKVYQFLNYDAVWVAPGPFDNAFFLSGIINNLLETNLPILITGEGFKTFVELMISKYNLNPNQEKLISDNLNHHGQFERVEVIPVSNELKKIYQSLPRQELSAVRYSLYPQLLGYLKKDVIDIEAVNQFDDPEIISLKRHPFCVASMSKPQICSTREMPHPLISSFINFANRVANSEALVSR